MPVKIYCEVCFENIALADKEALVGPIKGSMFRSPDPFHGVPDPFPPSIDWEAIRCPWCRNRPFLAEDAVTTENGLYQFPKEEDKPMPVSAFVKPQEAPDNAFVCEVCGKSFKIKVALAGHKRSHK